MKLKKKINFKKTIEEKNPSQTELTRLTYSRDMRS
jgi:hypothetical protein